MLLSTFSYAIDHLYIFLGEMSVQIFCPFSVGLIVIIITELYMFFIYSRYKTVRYVTLNIFFHPIDCLFFKFVVNFVIH